MLQAVKQKEIAPSTRRSRSPSPILMNRKETTSKDIISYLNENLMKIFFNLISTLILILFLLFYLDLRKLKKEEIEKLTNSQDPKQMKRRKEYYENHCDQITNLENPPPILVKICKEFDECIHTKKVYPTVSELIAAHLGSLTNIFINELKSKTNLSVLTILGIVILVDTLRNRPKIVI